MKHYVYVAAVFVCLFFAPANVIAAPRLDTSSSLGGADKDQNGVRDDIDDYIESLNLSTEQKYNLYSLAQTFQLIITTEPTSLNAKLSAALVSDIQMGTTCFMSSFGGTNLNAANDIRRDIELFTVNTNMRKAAIKRFIASVDKGSMPGRRNYGC